MDKKRRVVEGLKNLLIVALTCSALWLIADSQVFQVSGLLGRHQHSEGAAAPGPVQSQRLLPVRMAVMSQSGCCGIQYDSADLGAAYDRMAPLLNEALSGAGEPRTVSREEWERMLTSAPGMYFDFQGAIPLRVLSGWLSGQSNPGLTGSARHLLLGVIAIIAQKHDLLPHRLHLGNRLRESKLVADAIELLLPLMIRQNGIIALRILRRTAR